MNISAVDIVFKVQISESVGFLREDDEYLWV